MNKVTKTVLAVVVLMIAGFAGYKSLAPNNSPTPIERTETGTKTPDNSTTSSTKAKQGRYTTYSSGAVADTGYSTSVVFFFAPWCPECQAFKKSLDNGPLPQGVQVLETDYDSSTDLKKQYEVTIQSTFVRVNTSGDLQKKWVGYGKDKSSTTVLENLK